MVEFDGNVVLDLHTLGPFLDKYTSKPLLLLDWSYHEDCGDDGFQCFSRELSNMLHTRQKYIEDSRENVEAWWLGAKFRLSAELVHRCWVLCLNRYLTRSALVPHSPADAGLVVEPEAAEVVEGARGDIGSKAL